MTETLLPTTVVGSYPQPDWLIDRDKLTTLPPARVRASELWRVPEPWLEEAQNDATVLAIRDMERAGIDIITDGEIRRESYSNRFATALSGIDLDNPATVRGRSSGTVVVPRIIGPIRRLRPVEVRDVEFLRRNTDRRIKITLPGPFTMSRQAKNEFYQCRRVPKRRVAWHCRRSTGRSPASRVRPHCICVSATPMWPVTSRAGIHSCPS